MRCSFGNKRLVPSRIDIDYQPFDAAHYAEGSLYRLFECQKDMFYRFMNNDNVDWSSLLYHLNKHILSRISCRADFTKSDRPVCLVADETVHSKDMPDGERIIVSYSQKRAVKDTFNRERGIQRLEKAYGSGKVSKKNINQRGYNKFSRVDNDVSVSINYDRIEEDAKWDGWKSYVTNTDSSPEEVISMYRCLWVVERAFRISKGTLEMRPVFHFTEKGIESHVCICFVAYKLYKELERVIAEMKLGMGVDTVLDIAKTIPTLVVELPYGQKLTRTIFSTPQQKSIKGLFPRTT